MNRKSYRHGTVDTVARKTDRRLLRKAGSNGAFVRRPSDVRAARRLAEAGLVYVVSTKWGPFSYTRSGRIRELFVTESWTARLRYLSPTFPGRRPRGLEPVKS